MCYYIFQKLHSIALNIFEIKHEQHFIYHFRVSQTWYIIIIIIFHLVHYNNMYKCACVGVVVHELAWAACAIKCLNNAEARSH